MEQPTKPKISNIEWGLVIGALFTIDLIQIALDWIVIGFVLNPFIDIFVGMSVAFYLHIRGQKLTSPKRLAALLATFFGEMIPVVSELPLWGLDGIFNMAISKSDAVLSKVPGASNVIPIKQAHAVQNSSIKKSPENQNEEVLKEAA